MIVQTLEYGTLLRLIKQGSSIGKYHLYSLNVNSTFNNQMILDAEILSAAPIKWHRKLTNVPIAQQVSDPISRETTEAV